ncbi:hypothetical protein ACHAWF_012509 [Thalassiosira exigua]
MAAGTPIPPLTNSQKIFLQRLLVRHVVTDEEARELYAAIEEAFADVEVPEYDDAEDGDDGDGEDGSGTGGVDQGYLGRDLDHCLGLINRSLVPAFGLEVCTVTLPPPYRDGDDDEDEGLGSREEGSEGTPGSRTTKGGRKAAAKQRLVKYHAVANRSSDGPARSHAFPPSRGGGPHEMAYYRLVLERLVERGAENLERAENTENRRGSGVGAAAASVGCPGALSRMELINLRVELEGAHKDKLSVAQTERALDVLEQEGWLARAAPPPEDDDGDDGDDDDEEEGGRAKRKRKKGRASSGGGSRRKSLRGTFYGVGPRSFVELGEFLQKAGLPAERMPQSILHRA